MLRDPLAAKKFADHFGLKKIAKSRKKNPLEPLDLLATVGQSCVCECVCVCVISEEQRCGVVTLMSLKIHILLSVLLSFFLSTTTNYLCLPIYCIHNSKTNGSFTFIP